MKKETKWNIVDFFLHFTVFFTSWFLFITAATSAAEAVSITFTWNFVAITFIIAGVLKFLEIVLEPVVKG